MLGPAQSSAIPRRTLAGGIPQPTEADQRPHPEGLSRSTKTDEPRYSIRIADSPGTLCAACGKQETGTGPVGYLGEEPVCDLCLLGRTTDLGMAMALIAVTCAYASIGSGMSEAHQDAMVCAFARFYHRNASKSWPARIFWVPSLTAPDDTTH